MFRLSLDLTNEETKDLHAFLVARRKMAAETLAKPTDHAPADVARQYSVAGRVTAVLGMHLTKLATMGGARR